jgi:hypothetical protein
METCVIDSSDKSDSEFSYGNYAAPPTTDEQSELPIKDFWMPQDATNADLRVESSKPELSHRLSQREIYAKHPRTTTPLPFGRIKILKKALMYRKEDKALELSGRRKYNIKFDPQRCVDMACAADGNRPISVDYSTYKPAQKTIQVSVSSYLISCSHHFQGYDF